LRLDIAFGALADLFLPLYSSFTLQYISETCLARAERVARAERAVAPTRLLNRPVPARLVSR
jgi:hypothetical protein